MNRNYLKLSAVAIATLLIAPVAIHAQDEKEKEKSDKKNVEQIIITRKGDNKEKVTVEINGDKVTVNGKPIEDLKDNGDITVNRHKFKEGGNMRAFASPNENWNFNWNDNENMFFNENENAAMLGVMTEREDEGVKITNVTKESGAAKAGLKEDDIITKVDDKKVEDPDDLTKVIRGHKAGDKVTITYLRDKKEQKTTAELTKWKGAGFNALMKMPEMDWNTVEPKIKGIPRAKMSPGQYYGLMDNHPRLGLSVQDVEDGKGVKVIDVDDEGNAEKAGVKENDVILSINDKEVSSADEVAKIVRENKEKGSIMLKIKRGGKTQNIEVKMPRKLKTADL
jgi:serine protease Do